MCIMTKEDGGTNWHKQTGMEDAQGISGFGMACSSWTCFVWGTTTAL